MSFRYQPRIVSGAELADLAALRRNEAEKITEAAKTLAAIVAKHKGHAATHGTTTR